MAEGQNTELPKPKKKRKPNGTRETMVDKEGRLLMNSATAAGYVGLTMIRFRQTCANGGGPPSTVWPGMKRIRAFSVADLDAWVDEKIDDGMENSVLGSLIMGKIKNRASGSLPIFCDLKSRRGNCYIFNSKKEPENG